MTNFFSSARSVCDKNNFIKHARCSLVTLKMIIFAVKLLLLCFRNYLGQQCKLKAKTMHKSLKYTPKMLLRLERLLKDETTCRGGF